MTILSLLDLQRGFGLSSPRLVLRTEEGAARGDGVLQSFAGDARQGARGVLHASGRMRVFHCISTMLGGGAERQLCYLAEGLVERGHEVDVALLEGGPNLARLERSGARVHRLPALRGRWDFRGPLYLRELIRSSGADVVQTWLSRMSIWGGVAAVSLGVPWVSTERSSHAVSSGLVHDIGYRVLLGRSQHLVANSEGGASTWRRLLPSTHPVAVVGNALPVREIVATPTALRASFGLRDDDEVLVWSGRFDTLKGIRVFAKGLETLFVARPRLRVVACGDGPDLPWFRREMETLGFGARVTTLGYRTDLWSLMKMGDVFCSPSKVEGRPNVVMEAMACGLPMAVSTIPAHREIVGEGSAQWFDPEAPDAMVARIAWLLDHPVAAMAQRDAAFQDVLAHSQETMTLAYEAVYQQVLHGR